MVDLAFFGAPLALEGVSGQEQGLGVGASVGETAFEFEEVRGEVDVFGEGGGEGGGGGCEAGVCGGGRVS